MKLRKILFSTTIVCIMLLTFSPLIGSDICNAYTIHDNATINVDSISIINDSMVTCAKRDSLHDALKSEVHTYISNKSPQMANKLTHHIVNIGIDKSFDICFMLAQAELETSFGTKGWGISRKSIFGVRSKYSTYEECIEKYVDLVQLKYMGDVKTEQHLLNNYVTLRGNARYATNKNYETELRVTYDRILAKTDIRDIQNQLAEIQ